MVDSDLDSGTSGDFDEFELLVVRYLDGNLDEEGVREVESRIRESESCRATFVAIARQVACIAEQGVADVAERWPPYRLNPPAQPAEPVEPPRKRWLVVGAVMLGLSLLVMLGIWWPVTPPPDLPVVARVVRSSNSELADTVLDASSTLSSAEGSCEVHFESGVRVVLVAPFRVSAWNANGVRLDLGRATAYVPPGAEGFFVETAAGRVIDRGTEFGVVAAVDGQVEVDVFDGRVEAVLGGRGRELRTGQGASVTANGEPRFREARLEGYPRINRVSPERRVDLVRLLGGGEFGPMDGIGIDVRTGLVVAEPPNQWFWDGDTEYHPVPSNQFVDGVFVPDGDSGPVIVDSAGHAFDGFPNTSRGTFGVLFAGTWAPNSRIDGEREPPMGTVVGGHDYAGRSLVDMHANKGFTVDLDAVRRDLGGRGLARFVTLAGNAEVRTARGDFDVAERTRSDLWVLVDGEPRFVRRAFNAADGVLRVEVALRDNDRFLTIAASDAGNGTAETWVLLVDPVLETAETN